MKSLPTTPLACTCINSLAVPVFVCIDSFGSAEGAFDPDFSLDSDWQHHWRTAASCTLSIHSLEGTEHNSRCTAEWLHLKWISTQNLKKKKKHLLNVSSQLGFFTRKQRKDEDEKDDNWHCNTDWTVSFTTRKYAFCSHYFPFVTWHFCFRTTNDPLSGPGGIYRLVFGENLQNGFKPDQIFYMELRALNKCAKIINKHTKGRRMHKTLWMTGVSVLAVQSSLLFIFMLCWVIGSHT